jgi:hypothetical protein
VTTTLSTRAQKYLIMANSVSFTREEYELLKGSLDTCWLEPTTEEKSFDMAFSMSQALHDYIETGHCYETYNQDETDNKGVVCATNSVPLTFTQYLLVNFRRIFFFLALVPLDQVGRYINDPSLELFVRWRLTIAR